jgi:hypothetical protein
VALATFYRWRQKYGPLTKSELVRPNELERENSRLKKLGAELTLDKPILQDVLEKRAEARAPARARGPDRISECWSRGGRPRSSHRDRSVRQDPHAPRMRRTMNPDVDHTSFG